MKLTLLSREGCSLCNKTAALMEVLGLEFETVDVDRDESLRDRYGEAIPVVLADGREVCRAPVTRENLRSGLRAFNLGSGR